MILVIGMIFLPESPRYLIEKGRYSEAKRVLHKLHFDGTNGDWIEVEYNEIRRTIEAEQSVAAQGWMPMFTVPQWRTRMLFVDTPKRPVTVPSLTASLVTDSQSKHSPK